jgi:hypothetical protein
MTSPFLVNVNHQRCIECDETCSIRSEQAVLDMVAQLREAVATGHMRHAEVAAEATKLAHEVKNVGKDLQRVFHELRCVTVLAVWSGCNGQQFLAMHLLQCCLCTWQ